MKIPDPWEKNPILSAQLELALPRHIWMPIYPFIIDRAGPGHLGTGKPSSRIN